ncbi:MAG: hypothetical protein ACRD2P_17700 [Terriglobia bacterium]
MRENSRGKIAPWFLQYRIIETGEAIASCPIRAVLRDAQPMRRASRFENDRHELRALLRRHADNIPLIGTKASSRRSVAFDDAQQSIRLWLETKLDLCNQQPTPDLHYLWGDIRRFASKLRHGLETRIADAPEALQLALAGSIKVWERNRLPREAERHARTPEQQRNQFLAARASLRRHHAHAKG